MRLILPADGVALALIPGDGGFRCAHSNDSNRVYESGENTKFHLGGAKGIRTPDLFHAMEARYQLRHSPKRLIEL